MDSVTHRRRVVVVASLVLTAFAGGVLVSMLSRVIAAESGTAKPEPAAAPVGSTATAATSGTTAAPATAADAAATKPAPPATGIEGWLEGVVGKAVAGGKVVVGGWAADRVAGAPVPKVEVLLDDEVVATANLGVERPDVAKTIGRDGYARSGWNAVIDLAGVAPGKHEVSAVAIGAGGVRTALQGTRTIDVLPAS